MIELGKYNTSFVVKKTNVERLTYRDPAKWDNLDYRVKDLVLFMDAICEVSYVGYDDLVLTIFKNKETIIIDGK